MDAWKTIRMSVSAAALYAGAFPAAAGAEPPSGAAGRPANASLVRIGDPFTARAVRSALQGATRQLERPRCQQIFEEFRDVEGRSLQQNLQTLGETGGSYMEKLFFYEGGDARLCRRNDVLAFTTPGSRVVMICGLTFRSVLRGQPQVAEAVLIHEALHSLGLGENPPSSRDITARVLKQCR